MRIFFFRGIGLVNWLLKLKRIIPDFTIGDNLQNIKYKKNNAFIEIPDTD